MATEDPPAPPKDPALLLKLLRERKKAVDPAASPAESPAPRGPLPIPAADRGLPLPASFAQERLWLLDRIDPGGATFNMPVPLRLRGRLAVPLLARALGALEERHESLRTTFAGGGDGIFQVVHPPSFRLAEKSLEGEPDPAAALAGEIAAAGREPFDLERGPLFRALLLRLAPDDHVLVLNLHHAIADGWSIGVLFRELRALLEACDRDEPAPLPPLAVQYADYAAWQRSPAWAADFDRQLAYWRERLAEPPATLSLPADRPRPIETGGRTGKIALLLDRATADPLRALAGRHGGSLFMPLLTAFKIVLARLAGQDDVLVGTPIAGRHRRELEDLIGIFLNTLVLRTRIEPGLSFREAMLRVRETVLGATSHQDVPFEKLLAELQPERQLNQSPLFQVFFNMANIPDLRFELPGLEVSFEAMPELGAKFDLNLYVLEQGENLALSLVYNPDLFDLARMRDFMEQLGGLLDAAAADPDRNVMDFDLVGPTARRRLPDPRAPLPLAWPGSVTELFAARAAATPDAVAIEDGAARITYRELAARMERLAARLADAGVGRGEVVAIWAHRSALLAEALLGILRRGAAFVILDPANPLPRLADFVSLAAPAALVLLEGSPPVPGEADVFLPRLRLALGREESDPAPPFTPDFVAGPDELALVAFTSGSTGRPKAISGALGSLTAFLPFVAERFAIGPGDRQSVLSALSHDPLQRDVFYGLCLGMTLVLPDPARLGAPGYLARFVRETRITVANLVPSLLQLLLTETEAAGQGLPDLRRVFTVGEALQQADVRRLYAQAPQASCINLYGATETQRALSFLELPRESGFDSASEEGPDPGSRGLGKAILPLGRGMDGMQLLVLNPRGALAGVGELGEIVIRSRYLALGYADPAETAAKFVATPDAADPGDRMYRTGDLGRFLPGGGVEFAGRADFQVKIRGFRIELPEIEAVLRRHPAVAEAVVVLRREDGEAGGEGRLVAYWVPASRFSKEEAAEELDRLDRFDRSDRSDSAAGSAELRSHLLAALPDYMVPAAFVRLAGLPLNRAGKLDRSALPAPEAEVRRAGRPPATADQQVLAAIWERLLGRENVLLDDHFFELGGHSLLATLLLSRVRSAFGVDLPLRAVFERPRLEAFASHLAEMRSRRAPAPPLRQRPAGLRRRAPLSFAQQRLFFLEQLEPGSNAYLLFGALRLHGPLDREALSRALRRLAERHEALRTHIAADDGEGFQAIAEAGREDGRLLGWRDLAQLPPAAAETEARVRAGELAASALPLDGERLWCAELLRLAPTEHLFLLAIHHIVADGWSLGIFLRELGAFYGEELGGAPAALPPLAIHYADFAAWEREWLRGEALAGQLAFWREHLAGAPAALELPADFPRPRRPSYRGRRLPFTFPAELADGLRAFGREQGATLFMVLLAGFDLLLARLSGQDTVVVGTPVAHRDRAELEGPIGFFANTLPLRLDVDREKDFAGLVAELRRSLLDAFSHQDLPFEKLVAELGVERDLSRSPVFQAFFGLQTIAAEGAAWGEARLAPVAVPLGRAQFDLTWTAVDNGSDIGGYFDYASDLFAEETVAAWSRRLLHLFAALLADPKQPVGAIDLRLPEDFAFAAAWNATARDFDLDLPIHERIAENAQRHPDKVALGVEGEAAYTYAELDVAAEKLAARLRQEGIGPESVVGLAIGRLPSLVVAQLAVWKAGGAYLPLDPVFPAERLAFMLEDSGARLLLVDSRGEPASPELLAKAAIVLDLADAAQAVSVGDSWPPPSLPRHSLPARRTGDWAPAFAGETVEHSFSDEQSIQSEQVSKPAPLLVDELQPQSSPPRRRGPSLQPPSSPSRHALAYVLYTSGSTGKPKGVMIEHGALINFLLAMAETPGIGGDDRLLSLTTPSFDIAGLEIWLPLLAGARVDLARRETLKDGAALGAAISASGATMVQATPATWTLLLESGWAGAPGLKALCGGEALKGELAERLLPRVRSLWNVYGPTETTIWSTVRQVLPGELPAIVPLGGPIANTQIRIAERGGRDAASGIAGELTIGGAGLARGYHGRPALTAERFVPDAESPLPGARIYRSGDLARRRPDGELEFLGRLDFQVKVRGYRIELGEIEAALLAHPGVAQAVVVARHDGPSGARLVGYFRAAEGAAAEPAELQEQLRRALPDYMVPAVLVRLDAFPLTPNLKIDRRALPAPAAPAAIPSRPPESPREKVLAASWQEILGLEQVGAEDNFFALGGDSILVIRVVARARQHGLELRPADLFTSPTLAALAAAAREAAPAAAPAAVEAKRQGDIVLVGDLSAADLEDLFGG